MPGVLIVPATPTGGGGPGSSSGAGWSRLDYWSDLGRQLGRVQRFTVFQPPSQGDRSRLVFVDELVDAERPTGDLGGGYLYVLDGSQAGVQRRVLSSGDEAPIGALVLSRPFVSPLAVGTTVAYTDPCPVIDIGAMRGLVSFCEEALRRLRV